MIASVLPVTSTTAVRAINKGVFIATSLLRVPRTLLTPAEYRSSNKRAVNGLYTDALIINRALSRLSNIFISRLEGGVHFFCCHLPEFGKLTQAVRINAPKPYSLHRQMRAIDVKCP